MKKFLLPLLLICALAPAPSVFGGSTRPRAAHTSSARTAAIPYALEVSPDFPGGEKALELWDQGRLEQAIRLLEKPVHRKPVADAHRRLLLGVLLLELDEPVEGGAHASNGRAGRPESTSRQKTAGKGPSSASAGAGDRHNTAASSATSARKAHAERAVKALAGLEAALPDIADHVIALQGRALLQDGRPEEAIAVLRTLPDSSPLRDRTVRLIARSELERDQPDRALVELEALTADRPLEALGAETMLIKARALSRLGTDPGTVEALRHFRALTIYHPLSGEAKEARDSLEALRARGLEVPPLTPQEQLVSANTYLGANLNSDAATRLDALFKLPELEPSIRCEVTYGLGTALQNQRKYTDATAPLTEAARICDVDRQVRALYRLGRGAVRKGDLSAAEPILLDLANRYPDHSYADDALFLLGTSYQDKGDLERGSALLEDQIRRFPEGDMRGEAAWRLAWIAYRKGDIGGAIARVEGVLSAARLGLRPRTTASAQSTATPQNGAAALQKGGSPAPGALAAGPSGAAPVPPEAPSGQAPPGPLDEAAGDTPQAPRLTREAYWRARWLELGSSEQRAAAPKAYQTLVRFAPVDYYGLLAYLRLRQIAPKLAGQVAAEDATQLASKVSRVALDLEAHAPGIGRAITLLRSGLRTRAVRELTPLVTNGGGDDDLLIAYLLEKARRFDLSHAIPRKWIERTAAVQVDAQNRLQFYLAFPPAFEEAIDAAAKAEQIDPMLLRALAREESAFDPAIRSWAGAVGLVQLMEPTAQRQAKQLKKKVSGADLVDPALNARLGAHYLASLLKMFSSHPGLAVPAYNAGEGAVARWLKERGSLPFDEFVEEIPYRQTRDYVKRVLSSYQTYQYLYKTGKPFLELSLTLQ